MDLINDNESTDMSVLYATDTSVMKTSRLSALELNMVDALFGAAPTATNKASRL